MLFLSPWSAFGLNPDSGCARVGMLTTGCQAGGWFEVLRLAQLYMDCKRDVEENVGDVTPGGLCCRQSCVIVLLTGEDTAGRGDAAIGWGNEKHHLCSVQTELTRLLHKIPKLPAVIVVPALTE